MDASNINTELIIFCIFYTTVLAAWIANREIKFYIKDRKKKKQGVYCRRFVFS